MEEEEELLAQNEVKDPRAGNVSVSLPQLKADFNQLADHLYKVGKLIKSLHFQNSNLHDIRSTQVGKNWRYIKQSLKVSKFQNKFMMSSFFPKNKQNIARISALTFRAEILAIFRSFFGKNDDFINLF